MPAPSGVADGPVVTVANRLPEAALPTSPAPVGRQTVLAAFEDAEWPRFLTRLDLDPGRDYVALGYLPPRVPFDMGSPERARASFARLLSDPLALALSPARIGHLVVAWQCDGQRGITSHSGDLGRRAFPLIAAGWGLSAVLATHTDGGLVPAAAFPRAQDRALAAGRGAVLAAEVGRADCAAMRDRLAAFATSPNARRYGLLEDPGAGGGAGCLSFGTYLAESAGLLGQPRNAFDRVVQVPPHLVGLRTAPEGIEPYRPPGLSGPVPARRVPMLDLIREPWVGPQSETVRLPDGEAILAALVAPRDGIAAPDDWLFDRVLPPDDPLIAGAARAARDWAAAYPVRRIADPGGVAALVLER